MKKHLKGFVAGILTVVLLSATIVYAVPAVREIHFGINVVLNGQEVQFDEDSMPFIMDGRTFLPLGAMARLLGLPVEFDPETTTVYVGYKEPSELLIGTWAEMEPWGWDAWEWRAQFLEDGRIRGVEVNLATGEEVETDEYYEWRVEGNRLWIIEYGASEEDSYVEEFYFTIFRDIFGDGEMLHLYAIVDGEIDDQIVLIRR